MAAIRRTTGCSYIPTVIGRSIANRLTWHNRVQYGAFERLERHAGKLARAVLRGVRPLTAQETTSEKLRLDNSVRATQQAERLGKPLGQKLADKSSAAAHQKRRTAQPWVLG